jgi:UDP-glucose-4-epimerase GalE
VRDHQIDNFVFSSTCATYGIPDTTPIEETCAQRPINPYGSSKWMIEQVIKDFHVAHPLNYMILRYFNAVGADPEGDVGEDHNPENHLLPLAIDVALGRRASINVFGQDYPTADGACIRDYIHVTDLARAHVAALQSLLKGGKSKEFNLGTGRGYSVLEVLAKIEEISGKNLAMVHGDQRPGDPAELVANVSKIQHQLDWRPILSDLETIVKTALAWHRTHFAQQ